MYSFRGDTPKPSYNLMNGIFTNHYNRNFALKEKAGD